MESNYDKLRQKESKTQEPSAQTQKEKNQHETQLLGIAERQTPKTDDHHRKDSGKAPARTEPKTSADESSPPRLLLGEQGQPPQKTGTIPPNQQRDTDDQPKPRLLAAKGSSPQRILSETQRNAKDPQTQPHNERKSALTGPPQPRLLMKFDYDKPQQRKSKTQEPSAQPQKRKDHHGPRLLTIPERQTHKSDDYHRRDTGKGPEGSQPKISKDKHTPLRLLFGKQDHLPQNNKPLRKDNISPKHLTTDEKPKPCLLTAEGPTPDRQRTQTQRTQGDSQQEQHADKIIVLPVLQQPRLLMASYGKDAPQQRQQKTQEPRRQRNEPQQKDKPYLLGMQNRTRPKTDDQRKTDSARDSEWRQSRTRGPLSGPRLLFGEQGQIPQNNQQRITDTTTPNTQRHTEDTPKPRLLVVEGPSPETQRPKTQRTGRDPERQPQSDRKSASTGSRQPRLLMPFDYDNSQQRQRKTQEPSTQTRKPKDRHDPHLLRIPERPTPETDDHHGKVSGKVPETRQAKRSAGESSSPRLLFREHEHVPQKTKPLKDTTYPKQQRDTEDKLKSRLLAAEGSTADSLRPQTQRTQRDSEREEPAGKKSILPALKHPLLLMTPEGKERPQQKKRQTQEPRGQTQEPQEKNKPRLLIIPHRTKSKTDDQQRTESASATKTGQPKLSRPSSGPRLLFGDQSQTPQKTKPQTKDTTRPNQQRHTEHTLKPRLLAAEGSSLERQRPQTQRTARDPVRQPQSDRKSASAGSQQPRLLMPFDYDKTQQRHSKTQEPSRQTQQTKDQHDPHLLRIPKTPTPKTDYHHGRDSGKPPESRQAKRRGGEPFSPRLLFAEYKHSQQKTKPLEKDTIPHKQQTDPNDILKPRLLAAEGYTPDKQRPQTQRTQRESQREQQTDKKSISSAHQQPRLLLSSYGEDTPQRQQRQTKAASGQTQKPQEKDEPRPLIRPHRTKPTTDDQQRRDSASVFKERQPRTSGTSFTPRLLIGNQSQTPQKTKPQTTDTRTPHQQRDKENTLKPRLLSAKLSSPEIQRPQTKGTARDPEIQQQSDGKNASTGSQQPRQLMPFNYDKPEQRKRKTEKPSLPTQKQKDRHVPRLLKMPEKPIPKADDHNGKDSGKPPESRQGKRSEGDSSTPRLLFGQQDHSPHKTEPQRTDTIPTNPQRDAKDTPKPRLLALERSFPKKQSPQTRTTSKYPERQPYSDRKIASTGSLPPRLLMSFDYDNPEQRKSKTQEPGTQTQKPKDRHEPHLLAIPERQTPKTDDHHTRDTGKSPFGRQTKRSVGEPSPQRLLFGQKDHPSQQNKPHKKDTVYPKSQQESHDKVKPGLFSTEDSPPDRQRPQTQRTHRDSQREEQTDKKNILPAFKQPRLLMASQVGDIPHRRQRPTQEHRPKSQEPEEKNVPRLLIIPHRTKSKTDDQQRRDSASVSKERQPRTTGASSAPRILIGDQSKTPQKTKPQITDTTNPNQQRHTEDTHKPRLLAAKVPSPKQQRPQTQRTARDPERKPHSERKSASTGSQQPRLLMPFDYDKSQQRKSKTQEPRGQTQKEEDHHEPHLLRIPKRPMSITDDPRGRDSGKAPESRQAKIRVGETSLPRLLFRPKDHSPQKTIPLKKDTMSPDHKRDTYDKPKPRLLAAEGSAPDWQRPQTQRTQRDSPREQLADEKNISPTFKLPRLLMASKSGDRSQRQAQEPRSQKQKPEKKDEPRLLIMPHRTKPKTDDQRITESARAAKTRQPRTSAALSTPRLLFGNNIQTQQKTKPQKTDITTPKQQRDTKDTLKPHLLAAEDSSPKTKLSQTQKDPEKPERHSHTDRKSASTSRLQPRLLMPFDYEKPQQRQRETQEPGEQMQKTKDIHQPRLLRIPERQKPKREDHHGKDSGEAPESRHAKRSGGEPLSEKSIPLNKDTPSPKQKQDTKDKLKPRLLSAEEYTPDKQRPHTQRTQREFQREQRTEKKSTSPAHQQPRLLMTPYGKAPQQQSQGRTLEPNGPAEEQQLKDEPRLLMMPHRTKPTTDDQRKTESASVTKERKSRTSEASTRPRLLFGEQTRTPQKTKPQKTDTTTPKQQRHTEDSIKPLLLRAKFHSPERQRPQTQRTSRHAERQPQRDRKSASTGSQQPRLLMPFDYNKPQQRQSKTPDPRTQTLKDKHHHEPHLLRIPKGQMSKTDDQQERDSTKPPENQPDKTSLYKPLPQQPSLGEQDHLLQKTKPLEKNTIHPKQQRDRGDTPKPRLLAAQGSFPKTQLSPTQTTPKDPQKQPQTDKKISSTDSKPPRLLMPFNYDKPEQRQNKTQDPSAQTKKPKEHHEPHLLRIPKRPMSKTDDQHGTDSGKSPENLQDKSSSDKPLPPRLLFGEPNNLPEKTQQLKKDTVPPIQQRDPQETPKARLLAAEAPLPKTKRLQTQTTPKDQQRQPYSDKKVQSPDLKTPRILMPFDYNKPEKTQSKIQEPSAQTKKPKDHHEPHLLRIPEKTMPKPDDHHRRESGKPTEGRQAETKTDEPSPTRQLLGKRDYLPQETKPLEKGTMLPKQQRDTEDTPKPHLLSTEGSFPKTQRSQTITTTDNQDKQPHSDKKTASPDSQPSRLLMPFDYDKPEQTQSKKPEPSAQTQKPKDHHEPHLLRMPDKPMPKADDHHGGDSGKAPESQQDKRTPDEISPPRQLFGQRDHLPQKTKPFEKDIMPSEQQRDTQEAPKLRLVAAEGSFPKQRSETQTKTKDPDKQPHSDKKIAPTDSQQPRLLMPINYDKPEQRQSKTQEPSTQTQEPKDHHEHHLLRIPENTMQKADVQHGKDSGKVPESQHAKTTPKEPSPPRQLLEQQDHYPQKTKPLEKDIMPAEQQQNTQETPKPRLVSAEGSLPKTQPPVIQTTPKDPDNQPPSDKKTALSDSQQPRLLMPFDNDKQELGQSKTEEPSSQTQKPKDHHEPHLLKITDKPMPKADDPHGRDSGKAPDSRQAKTTLDEPSPTRQLLEQKDHYPQKTKPLEKDSMPTEQLRATQQTPKPRPVSAEGPLPKTQLPVTQTTPKDPDKQPPSDKKSTSTDSQQPRLLMPFDHDKSEQRHSKIQEPSAQAQKPKDHHEPHLLKIPDKPMPKPDVQHGRSSVKTPESRQAKTTPDEPSPPRQLLGKQDHYPQKTKPLEKDSMPTEQLRDTRQTPRPRPVSAEGSLPKTQLPVTQTTPRGPDKQPPSDKKPTSTDSQQPRLLMPFDHDKPEQTQSKKPEPSAQTQKPKDHHEPHLLKIPDKPMPKADDTQGGDSGKAPDSRQAKTTPDEPSPPRQLLGKQDHYPQKTKPLEKDSMPTEQLRDTQQTPKPRPVSAEGPLPKKLPVTQTTPKDPDKQPPSDKKTSSTDSQQPRLLMPFDHDKPVQRHSKIQEPGAQTQKPKDHHEPHLLKIPDKPMPKADDTQGGDSGKAPDSRQAKTTPDEPSPPRQLLGKQDHYPQKTKPLEKDSMPTEQLRDTQQTPKPRPVSAEGPLPKTQLPVTQTTPKDPDKQPPSDKKNTSTDSQQPRLLMPFDHDKPEQRHSKIQEPGAQTQIPKDHHEPHLLKIPDKPMPKADDQHGRYSVKTTESRQAKTTPEEPSPPRQLLGKQDYYPQKTKTLEIGTMFPKQRDTQEAPKPRHVSAEGPLPKTQLPVTETTPKDPDKQPPSDKKTTSTDSQQPRLLMPFDHNKPEQRHSKIQGPSVQTQQPKDHHEPHLFKIPDKPMPKADDQHGRDSVKTSESRKAKTTPDEPSPPRQLFGKRDHLPQVPRGKTQEPQERDEQRLLLMPHITGPKTDDQQRRDSARSAIRRQPRRIGSRDELRPKLERVVYVKNLSPLSDTNKSSTYRQRATSIEPVTPKNLIPPDIKLPDGHEKPQERTREAQQSTKTEEPPTKERPHPLIVPDTQIRKTDYSARQESKQPFIKRKPKESPDKIPYPLEMRESKKAPVAAHSKETGDKFIEPRHSITQREQLPGKTKPQTPDAMKHELKRESYDPMQPRLVQLQRTRDKEPGTQQTNANKRQLSDSPRLLSIPDDIGRNESAKGTGSGRAKAGGDYFIKPTQKFVSPHEIPQGTKLDKPGSIKRRQQRDTIDESRPGPVAVEISLQDKERPEKMISRAESAPTAEHGPLGRTKAGEQETEQESEGSGKHAGDNLNTEVLVEKDPNYKGPPTFDNWPDKEAAGAGDNGKGGGGYDNEGGGGLEGDSNEGDEGGEGEEEYAFGYDFRRGPKVGGERYESGDGGSQTSVDSAVLRELRETEKDIQVLALELAHQRKEIKGLRDRIPVTDKDAKLIKIKQEEVQDLVQQLETLTNHMTYLVSRTLRPSRYPAKQGRAERFEGVCIKCKQRVCVCGKQNQVCICRAAPCICHRPKPYVAGTWKAQEMDPYHINNPKCACVWLESGVNQGTCKCIGDFYEECPCRQFFKDMEECKCRREDLEKFNVIADVIPKVVVCAPDVTLPRIIVCEPYMPKRVKQLRLC